MLQGILKVISFIPTIVTGIENLFGKNKGQDKQAAALQIVNQMVTGIEGVSGKDVINNEQFQEGLKKINDGVVQCLNASVWKK